MRRLLLFIGLVAACVAAGTAHAEAPAVPPGAVAVVAGETVTRARLDELLVSARRSYGSRRSSSSISAAPSGRTGGSSRQGLTAGQARANVRRQLLGQRIYATVVGDTVSNAAAAASWADWLDAPHARYAPLVAYAPGFDPS